MKNVHVGAVLGLASSVLSQALTGWYGNIGPQIVYQNATNGDLMYTLDTGTGSENGYIPWTKLTLAIAPKKGTALASTGYTGGNGQITAAIFYTSSSNAVTQALIGCDQSTGKCDIQGVWILSAAVSTGINGTTGLAASLRNAEDGYRVFYHDTDGRTRMLRYSGPKNITWGESKDVVTSNYQSSTALATDRGVNQTVYSVDRSGNITPATLNNDETWAALGSPSNLPAWSPGNVSLAATSSTDSSTKKLIYIGTDRLPHEVTSTDRGQTWTVSSSQSNDTWPLADTPNARFAFPSVDQSGSMSSLFYVSNDNLVQVVNENGNWQASKIIMKNLSGASSAPSPATGSSSPSAPKSSSNAVKIGAGVGVGIGIPLIIAIVLVAILLRRRRRRNRAATAAMATGDYTGYDHAAQLPRDYKYKSGDGMYEVSGQPVQEAPGSTPVVHELSHDQQHELPGAEVPRNVSPK